MGRGGAGRADLVARHLAGLLTAVLLLAACQTGTTAAPPSLPDGCHAPTGSGTASAVGTIEEAGLLVRGALFDIHGPDAEPVSQSMDGEIVDVGGERVWRLEGTFLVTADGERGPETWTFWVGFVDDELAVLCAEGPDDVPWSPPNSR